MGIRPFRFQIIYLYINKKKDKTEASRRGEPPVSESMKRKGKKYNVETIRK